MFMVISFMEKFKYVILFIGNKFMCNMFIINVMSIINFVT